MEIFGFSDAMLTKIEGMFVHAQVYRTSSNAAESNYVYSVNWRDGGVQSPALRGFRPPTWSVNARISTLGCAQFKLPTGPECSEKRLERLRSHALRFLPTDVDLSTFLVAICFVNY